MEGHRSGGAFTDRHSGRRDGKPVEFQELMDRGHVDVAQPDGKGRRVYGGKRVCDMAPTAKLIVPHCWKTGIGI
jgi:hypothetical protein